MILRNIVNIFRYDNSIMLDSYLLDAYAQIFTDKIWCHGFIQNNPGRQGMCEGGLGQ